MSQLKVNTITDFAATGAPNFSQGIIFKNLSVVNANPNRLISTDVNGDIELFPNGTGDVLVGSANFSVAPSGNAVITGDMDITGSLEVDQLNLNASTLSSTSGALNLSAPSGSNISLSVAGAGNVQVGSSNFSVSPLGVATISGQLNVDNLRMDLNTVSATTGDLILQHANVLVSSTGSVRAHNLQLGTAAAPNTIGVINSNGDIYLRPDGTGEIGFNTSSPAAKFHFDAGDMYFGSEAGAVQTLNFRRTSTVGNISTSSSVMNINGGTGSNHLTINSSGRIGIGTDSPATSAQIEISSTTGALLLPRMTRTQRNALTPVNGMLLYNTTDSTLEVYENSGWKVFTTSAATP